MNMVVNPSMAALRQPPAKAPANEAAPAAVVVQAPAPAPVPVEKPWWEALGSAVWGAASAAVDAVIVQPPKLLTEPVKAGIEWIIQTAANAVKELGAAVWKPKVPEAAPAPAPRPTTPVRAVDLPLRPEAVDVNDAISINNFCWHAAKKLLGRKPQLSEVAAWRAQIQAGKSAQDVVAMMQAMPEGQMNEAAQKALGRPLTETERAIFNLELSQGRKSLDDVLVDISAVASRVLAGKNPGQGTIDGRNAEAKAELGHDLTPTEQIVLDENQQSMDAVKDEIHKEATDTMADPADLTATELSELEGN